MTTQNQSVLPPTPAEAAKASWSELRSGDGLAARAATPQVGDRYHKPASEYLTILGNVRHHPVRNIIVEGVDHEWVTVNSDGYRTKLPLAQWPKLAASTIEHGAQFFPANTQAEARAAQNTYHDKSN